MSTTNRAGNTNGSRNRALPSVPWMAASPDAVTAMVVVTAACRPSGPAMATTACSSTPVLVMLPTARISCGRPIANWANQYP